MKIGGSSYNVYKRLFDSMVAPILDYEAPVWSRFCSVREVEKVQNRVYRFLWESVANIRWQLHLRICAGCQPHADINWPQLHSGVISYN